ncbi:MAG TPA: DPP IV N-terminal domain-containing protein, partial [Candidatus Polarisedimenticolia bacterium]|nr:DPP IV N-terminal domain-containing protein [Candidatus Polarisedimenticolia bacterium]
EEEDRFWYRKRVPGGHQFMYVDPAGNIHRPAFDHHRMAAAISLALGRAFVAYQLPFQELQFAEQGRLIEFWESEPKPRAASWNTAETKQEGDETAAGTAVEDAGKETAGEETAERGQETDSGGDRGQAEKKPAEEDKEPDPRRWRCSLETYVCSGPEKVAKIEDDEVKSPDGKWVAFARDENLWVRSLQDGSEKQLSTGGVEHFGYAVPPEGCCYTVTAWRQKTKRKPVAVWSPDSNRILTYRLDEREVALLHLIEAQEGRPKLHSYRTALPGDEKLPLYTLSIFAVASGAEVEVKTDPLILFWGEDPPDLRWGTKGERVYFTRIHRGHQRVELHAADAATGETRTIVEETGKTFIDLATNDDKEDWRIINDGAEVVWQSERDGWSHFYLYDAATGELKNRITSGSWYATNPHHVDERNRWLYFEAMGREEGQNPYAAQLYRVRLDGSRLQRLTPEDALHDIDFSPSGEWIVDTWSTRDRAPVTVLRNASGRVTRKLEEADISRLLEAGWAPGEPFVLQARDGVTDLYGFLYLPADFDPEKKYPIIDYIYPGPQIGSVFYWGFTTRPDGFVQSLAQLGFIVIHFNAMGTPFRSKAFHDVWYGDMGDNGLLDHVHVIKQLAARRPEIDLDRVGIYGFSGGGFSSTGAILRFPDFFKVAVSAAGNHDQRSYNFDWGERYQGPLRKNADGTDNYQSQANHLLAGNLKGKLMLTWGALDDNVHPNATLLLIQALIEHNKDFDLLVFPKGNHRYGGEPYAIRRTWDYFVEHLRGETPPAGYRIEAPPD